MTDFTFDGTNVSSGSATDKALSRYAMKSNAVIKQFVAERDMKENCIIQRPFTSRTKRCTNAYWTNGGETVHLFTKGASEIVFQRCTQMIVKDGQTKMLDDQLK